MRTDPRTWYGFTPPQVSTLGEGVSAFRAYDRYYQVVCRWLADKDSVYLVPCAGTKPIHTSPMHRSIYQKYARAFGGGREVLVVSEPAVLIRYADLERLEPVFMYDFPPHLLVGESRDLMVRRLAKALGEKDVRGCLPRHHADLVSSAVGSFENDWSGGLYEMAWKAARL